MTTKTRFFKTPARVLAQAGMLAMVVTLVCAPLAAQAATLTRQLQLGMSGSDVSTLQTFLATDNTIYPQGLVTGYFGSLTKSAVSNFQVRNNISSVGRVGPITLVAINAQMAGGIGNGSDVVAPTISSVNTSTSAGAVTVSWNTNEFSTGKVYYSTSPLTMYEHPTSVDVSGSVISSGTTPRTSQSVYIQGLQSNTTYYYLVYATDQSGNVNISLSSFRSL